MKKTPETEIRITYCRFGRGEQQNRVGRPVFSSTEEAIDWLVEKRKEEEGEQAAQATA